MTTTGTDLSGHRILLVEDEVIVAMMIAGELEDAGAEVIQAHSLREAIAASTDDTDFTAAVLDVNLKGQEVFPAAEILRSRRVPIVFHTGHVRPEDIARDYPEACVVSKPSQAGAIAAGLAHAAARRVAATKFAAA